MVLLFISGFVATPETNFAIADFWRWSVIHMWVEAFLEVFTTVVVAYHMYLMGLVSARMGDVDRAEEYAGQIAQQKFPAGYEALAGDFSRSVRAQIDRVLGRPADALKKLEPVLADTRNPLESPFVSEAYERFTRAELLYELNRYPEARGWYDHLVESSVFEFVYLPLATFRRAEILDRQGDSKGAEAGYKAFQRYALKMATGSGKTFTAANISRAVASRSSRCAM